MARFDKSGAYDSVFKPMIQEAFPGQNKVFKLRGKNGQSIFNWLETWPYESMDAPGGLDSLYGGWLQKDATQGYNSLNDPEVTFIWMQGEANTRNEKYVFYDHAFHTLVGQLKNDMGIDHINIVIGRITDIGVKLDTYLYVDEVRKIQSSMAEHSHYFEWVNTDDLNNVINNGELENRVHYNEGPDNNYTLLGERFARKAIQLINDNKPATFDQQYVAIQYPESTQVAAPGVLSTAFDKNGLPLSAVLVKGPSNAAQFTLNADGSFTYQPASGFTGYDSFTFTANNGQTDGYKSTVSIRVEPSISDLLVWYKFNENSGTNITDASGNAMDATLTGGSWSKGYMGGALDFGGPTITGSLTVPSAALTSVDQELTVTFWSYGDITRAIADFVITEAETSGGQTVTKITLPQNDDQVIFTAGGDSGNTTLYHANASDVYKWTHWAFTSNTSTGESKLYKNGTLVETQNGATHSMSGINTWTIGSSLSGANSYRGKIDDYRIYGRSLSAAEVAILATRPLTPYEAWSSTYGIEDEPRKDDLDQDQLSNELEYYFGLDPNTPDENLGIIPGVDAHAPSIQYSYRTDAEDTFFYNIETSSNLATWSPAQTTQIAPATANGDGTENIQLRSDINFDSQPNQFLRIVVDE
ncbi:MAG: LamG-like jellyroll fold domain-containing protein [Opitutales bacterium]